MLGHFTSPHVLGIFIRNAGVPMFFEGTGCRLKAVAWTDEFGSAVACQGRYLAFDIRAYATAGSVLAPLC